MNGTGTEAPLTPATAWDEMTRGNERFITGAPRHPRQDSERRAELLTLQEPHAVLFGCSDSRVTAEIIFDKGIGDLFVVRNAGHVVTESSLGSIEYGVAILGVPLLIVLRHEGCGAVRAAIDSEAPDATPLPPHINSLVEQIVPAVRTVHDKHEGETELDASEVGRQHLDNTIAQLLERSEIISDAVAAGTLAIVGASYRLAEGRAIRETVVGQV
ncbi:carbonic anhydrase [Parafrigoribacterium soli]|uniref:carbonic anhydrase n=1 Tax=Parafrigoribacterium soli TaxID=3144663 RepID=UPI0032EF01DF